MFRVSEDSYRDVDVAILQALLKGKVSPTGLHRLTRLYKTAVEENSVIFQPIHYTPMVKGVKGFTKALANQTVTFSVQRNFFCFFILYCG